MSHFTRIKTQMVEREEHVIRALQDLGYTVEVGNVEIRGFAGRRTGVEIKVPTWNRGYDIGFLSVNGAYEVIADWWGIRDTSRNQFVQQVTQRYAYAVSRSKLEDQGFTLVTEEVQDNGQIHLVLRRTV